MAAKRRRTRRGRKLTIPLAVVAGLMPISVSVIREIGNGAEAVGDMLTKRLTGYSPMEQKFDWENMKCGTLSILGGFGVHWLASRLGINRVLGRTGVPLLRV